MVTPRRLLICNDLKYKIFGSFVIVGLASAKSCYYYLSRALSGAIRTIPWGDRSRFSYDGDGNRIKMTVDVDKGPNGRGNGKGQGQGIGTDPSKCGDVVPPGFVPPGLAKKCGQGEEPYPDEHPGGPRDGWETQHKKKHWEFHYTNDISLALPEVLQVTEDDATKWKETFVYGAGMERISMTYLPAYDHDNGWEPTPGVGGADPDVTPKTLYYMTDIMGSTIGQIGRAHV